MGEGHVVSKEESEEISSTLFPCPISGKHPPEAKVDQKPEDKGAQSCRSCRPASQGTERSADGGVNLEGQPEGLAQSRSQQVAEGAGLASRSFVTALLRPAVSRKAWYLALCRLSVPICHLNE